MPGNPLFAWVIIGGLPQFTSYPNLQATTLTGYPIHGQTVLERLPARTAALSFALRRVNLRDCRWLAHSASCALLPPSCQPYMTERKLYLLEASRPTGQAYTQTLPQVTQVHLCGSGPGNHCCLSSDKAGQSVLTYTTSNEAWLELTLSLSLVSRGMEGRDVIKLLEVKGMPPRPAPLF